jgi:hypothetical protein
MATANGVCVLMECKKFTARVQIVLSTCSSNIIRELFLTSSMLWPQAQSLRAHLQIAAAFFQVTIALVFDAVIAGC